MFVSKKEHDAVCAERDGLKNKVTELEGSVQKITEERDSYKTTAEGLQTTVDGNAETVNGLNKEIGDLKAENSSLKAKVAELSGKSGEEATTALAEGAKDPGATEADKPMCKGENFMEDLKTMETLYGKK